MKRWRTIPLLIALISYLLTPFSAEAAAACTPSSFDEGGYRYLKFTSTTACDWTIPTGVRSINYLVVGGGGGGASRHGGGGGAGGLLQGTSVTVNWGAILSVTVGSGGSGAGTTTAAGTSGSDSVLSGGTLGTITAYKGGGGGIYTGTFGSGGGGTGSASHGNGTAGQGTDGGAGGANWACAGSTSGWCGGGGGGSASNTNVNYVSSGRAGNGGSGTAITWISTTVATQFSCGDIKSSSVYFSGGGGGGADVGGTAGTGGNGGGGAGSVGVTTATTATSCTGGGGGGSGYDNNGGQGAAGSGGSGVVIIRYLLDSTPPTFSSAANQSVSENTSVSSNAALVTVNESSTIVITGGVDAADVSIIRIDTLNASIRFLSIPNFESPLDSDLNNAYSVNIRATDEYGNYSDQSITITVTNVNEAPTITSNSSNPTWSTSQSENTSLVLDFDGSDVDSGTTLTWSISGTDAADFSMNGSTGVLAFASGPDFEAPLDSNLDNIYIVVVTLSDGALTDTSTITITVTNLNESISPDFPAISGTPYKGVSISITVKTYVSGKVRFYVGGKRIPNCLNISTSNSYPNATATCNWKPSVGGKSNIYASITPSDNTFSAAASPIASFFVLKRTGTRG